MEVVYRANDGIEAQLLIDQLEAEGIPARIDGTYLQGATGELPPGGLIRILTSSENRDHAIAVIDRWEAERASSPDIFPEPAARKSSWSGFAFLSGLVIGVAGSVYYFHAPSSTDGVDYNDDQVLDEIWTFAPSGDPTRFEMDRNLDGKIDVFLRYDRHHRVKDGKSDDDFDGTMDTDLSYVRGNINVMETDTDGDSKPNIRLHHNKGVIDSAETLDPTTGQPVRIVRYHLNAPVNVDIDTDQDGKLDTRVFYDALGNESRSEAVESRKEQP